MTAIDELCCCLEQAYLLDLVDVVTRGVFMDGQKRMCHTLTDYDGSMCSYSCVCSNLENLVGLT